jgi:hypothetical protein
VLLALASADRPVHTFEQSATVSELETWTGLSRSMTLKGIRRAVAAGLITYSPGKQGVSSRFTLIHPSSTAGGWAKLPNLQVRARIPRISHRGEVALAALKIYLILIAARKNDNTVIALKHETLRRRAGCQARQVRSAISLLANEGLIHVINEFDADLDLDESLDVIKAKSLRRVPVQRYAITGDLEAGRRWSEAAQADDRPGS